jgi:uncharacterized protein YjbJ (UPF0337 family)
MFTMTIGVFTASAANRLVRFPVYLRDRTKRALVSGYYNLIGNAVMDKDRVEGASKQVKGSVKEALGKVTGDTKTRVEGAAEKTVGKAQSAVGRAKDSARDALRK